MQKSVNKVGFHRIGAIIHTHRESQCLPYSRFFLEYGIFVIVLLYFHQLGPLGRVGLVVE